MTRRPRQGLVETAAIQISRRCNLETRRRHRPGFRQGRRPWPAGASPRWCAGRSPRQQLEIDSRRLSGLAKAGVLALQGRTSPCRRAGRCAALASTPQPMALPLAERAPRQSNGPISLQIYKPEDNGVGPLPMSEDCLTLNRLDARRARRGCSLIMVSQIPQQRLCKRLRRPHTSMTRPISPATGWWCPGSTTCSASWASSPIRC